MASLLPLIRHKSYIRPKRGFEVLVRKMQDKILIRVIITRILIKQAEEEP